MKKLFSSLFMFILFAVLAWGFAAWYFGANAEADLKAYLFQSEKMPGRQLFRAELLDYQKTLFGAKARLRISSDLSSINERVGDFVLVARLFNGPLFFNKVALKSKEGIGKPGFELGTARWHLTLDETSLAREESEYLNSLFPDGLPDAVIRSDFENSAHYQLDLKTSVADAAISGIFHLQSANNQGTVLLTNVRYGVAPNVLKADRGTISYKHQRGITAVYKPGTTHLTIPALEMGHEFLQQPILVSLSADAAIQSGGRDGSDAHQENNDVLDGLIKIQLEQALPGQMPVEKAELKIRFDNIPGQAFIAFSEAHARRDNLRQQIQWTLEESGELPEGQDQIWQLKNQLQAMQEQLPKQLARTFLKTGESQVEISITAVESASSDSPSANSALVKKGAQESTLNGVLSLNKKAENLSNILSLLQGEAEVTLGDALFDFLKPRAQLKKSSFKLDFEKGQLILKQ